MKKSENFDFFIDKNQNAKLHFLFETTKSLHKKKCKRKFFALFLCK